MRAQGTPVGAGSEDMALTCRLWALLAEGLLWLSLAEFLRDFGRLSGAEDEGGNQGPVPVSSLLRKEG